jgi:hypothetical protein
MWIKFFDCNNLHLGSGESEGEGDDRIRWAVPRCGRKGGRLVYASSDTVPSDGSLAYFDSLLSYGVSRKLDVPRRTHLLSMLSYTPKLFTQNHTCSFGPSPSRRDSQAGNNGRSCCMPLSLAVKTTSSHRGSELDSRRVWFEVQRLNKHEEVI